MHSVLLAIIGLGLSLWEPFMAGGGAGPSTGDVILWDDGSDIQWDDASQVLWDS